MEDWFYEHLDELKRRFIVVIATIGLVSIFSFSFGLSTFELAGYAVPYPELTVDGSISAVLFQQLQTDLLPENVELIVTRPADALFLQLGISFFVGFIVSLPMVVYQATKFVSPALEERERRAVRKAVFSFVPLFLVGAAFAYVLIIPMMLRLLYGYVFALDVLPFLNINDFASFVVNIVLAFGLIFVLPAVMAVLTSVGVDPGFWRRNWKYALGMMVIFGALVTPDGSLVTLTLVAGPMAALYFIGYIASRAVWESRAKA